MYGKIDFAGGQWGVGNLPAHVSIRFKQMFKGIPFAQTPPFILQDRVSFVRDLEWFTSRYPMEFTDRAAVRFTEQTQAWRDDMAALEALKAPDYRASLVTGFRSPEEARPHQKRAAEMFRQRKSLLLLDDVGLGKTVSSLAAISDGWGLPAAIVVQPHLSAQWITEYINRFTHLRAIEIKDRNARTLAAADVYVFRYSNIDGWVDYFEPLGLKTAIFDEVQELRHGKSTNKGIAAHALRSVVENAIGLTATPIYNYGSEIFHVVDLLSPGALGSWHEFITNWCSARGSHWIVTDPVALGAFLLDEGIALRRTADDAEVAMSLPPLRKMVLEVGWNEGDVDTDRELQVKLAQRVLRGSFTEKGQAARELDLLLRQETGIAKARSVAAYVRTLVEAGETVLLGGWHREVYRIWTTALADLNPLMFTGSETQPQKRKAKAALISGESKLLIMSLRSGAGLDGLQKVVRHVVIGELDWSPQVHRQFIGRAHRDGQTEQVTAHYLHVDGGSDPVIMSTLGLKASQSHGLLNPWGEVSASTEVDESRVKALARRILGLDDAK